MSTETPTLGEVLQFLLDDDRTDLHVALPGRVESYDAAKQTANIKPMTKRVARDADDERLVDSLPVITAVPVSWPRGGGYFMSMPLAVGDCGMIVFCESDLGAWRDSGQDSDPGDERRHGLAGAVFVPGLEVVAKALAGAATGHLVVGKDGGPGIHIDASFVQLGAAGGQFVALANLVQTALDSIKTTFNAHIHPASAGTTSPTATPIATLGPVAATIAKAT